MSSGVCVQQCMLMDVHVSVCPSLFVRLCECQSGQSFFLLAHLTLTLQRPVDHHSSDNSDKNSQMKISSVTHWNSEYECQGPAYSVCTLCLIFFNIALIFLPVFPVHSFKRYSTRKLAICIMYDILIKILCCLTCALKFNILVVC